MSTHQHIDRICCIVLALTLLLSAAFVLTNAFGAEPKAVSLGYEDRLFDVSEVHTVDIVMNDWDGFIEHCTDEEYVSCSVVIDGEAYKNVAIRAKGNTSLSGVQSMNSERYSFKIEFDHYDSTKTYHGLDKLCLNNIIQDNTYMKDYLTYQMMRSFGVASPLCSYAKITVNGEDWGLYLAVEAVEESFLMRNYGSDYGELYKPDSTDMGGGRGNGKDFRFENSFGETESGNQQPLERADVTLPEVGEGMFSGFGDGIFPERPDDVTLPEGGGQMPGQGGAMGGFGSDDVSLIYTDDLYSSYSNLFDNAKTDVSDSDKDRLIAAIKAMNEQNDLESCVDVDHVIRYFIVHNFVVNFDSYTGSMIHNYYLYEHEGQLSMIPWDYNLAFGGFQSASDATALVNYPIDSPVSGGTVESRPMLAWIFSDDDYIERYHALFSEWISDVFESGSFASMIDSVKAMIAPYVEDDPSKFCTYEEFTIGVDTLKEFCLLRAESIRGQLNGTIGSTDEAQSDRTNFVNADHLSVSAMGTMENTVGGNRPSDGDLPTMPNASAQRSAATAAEAAEDSTEATDDALREPSPPMTNGSMGDFKDPTQNSGGQPPNGLQQGGNMNVSPSGNGTSIGSADPGFSVSIEVWMLLLSVIVLAGGLVFAACFKRRK